MYSVYLSLKKIVEFIVLYLFHLKLCCCSPSMSKRSYNFREWLQFTNNQTPICPSSIVWIFSFLTDTRYTFCPCWDLNLRLPINLPILPLLLEPGLKGVWKLLFGSSSSFSSLFYLECFTGEYIWYLFIYFYKKLIHHALNKLDFALNYAFFKRCVSLLFPNLFSFVVFSTLCFVHGNIAETRICTGWCTEHHWFKIYDQLVWTSCTGVPAWVWPFTGSFLNLDSLNHSCFNYRNPIDRIFIKKHVAESLKNQISIYLWNRRWC